jgi:hypothetical protein
MHSVVLQEKAALQGVGMHQLKKYNMETVLSPYAFADMIGNAKQPK